MVVHVILVLVLILHPLEVLGVWVVLVVHLVEEEVGVRVRVVGLAVDDDCQVVHQVRMTSRLVIVVDLVGEVRAHAAAEVY